MKKILLALLLIGIIPTALIAGGSVSGKEINKTASADFTRVIEPTSSLKSFSVQVDYSTTTPTASTFTDGSFSSSTLTVTDYTGLPGTAATAALDFAVNTSAIDDAVITINGRTYTEGIDWDRLTLATATVASLTTALNAYSEYSAVRTSTAIALTAYDEGTFANSWTITSSTPAAIATTTWSGGLAFGYLSINGTTLTEGTDFDAETSSAVTAGNIADAINADSTLSAIVTATTTGVGTGMLQVVSDLTGINAYPITTSNASYLTVDYAQMANGAATDISVANDTIAETAHGFPVGLPVLFAVGSGTEPTGLTDGTTYYAIPTTANTFQLSDTSTGAVAGLDINITAVIGGTGSFTATPITFTKGSMGFNWEGSNDGTDFYDLGVTSVTYSADGGALWDFTDYNYKYLRFNFTGPTYGGLTIDATIFGKTE